MKLLSGSFRYFSRQPILSVLAPTALFLTGRALNNRKLKDLPESPPVFFRGAQELLRKVPPAQVFKYLHVFEGRIFDSYSCLRVCLASYWLLGGRAELKIGVNRTPEFAAHAWLESGGEVLTHESPQEYTEVLSFGSH